MIGILHTTQTADGTGRTLSRTMVEDRKEPHAIYEPVWDVEYVLHGPQDRSRALANLLGGVQTNNRDVDGISGPDVWQVEIVCFAESIHLRNDEWYSNLRKYLLRKSVELGIPYLFPLRFATSYGDAKNVRLTNDQWYNPDLSGWLGHCHVPENTHWDPGPIDLNRLRIPLPPLGDIQDMELTDVLPNYSVDGHSVDVQTILAYTHTQVDVIVKQQIPGIQAAIGNIQAVINSLPTMQSGSTMIDYDKIAEMVANKLAERLKS